MLQPCFQAPSFWTGQLWTLTPSVKLAAALQPQKVLNEIPYVMCEKKYNHDN